MDEIHPTIKQKFTQNFKLLNKIHQFLSVSPKSDDFQSLISRKDLIVGLFDEFKVALKFVDRFSTSNEKDVKNRDFKLEQAYLLAVKLKNKLLMLIKLFQRDLTNFYLNLVENFRLNLSNIENEFKIEDNSILQDRANRRSSNYLSPSEYIILQNSILADFEEIGNNLLLFCDFCKMQVEKMEFEKNYSENTEEYFDQVFSKERMGQIDERLVLVQLSCKKLVNS